MLFLEKFFISFPKQNHLREIHFIKCGEHSSGILGFFQAFGDPLAEAGHFDLFLAWAGGTCHGRSFCRSSSFWCFQMRDNIAFGNTTVFAGSGNIGRVQGIAPEQALLGRVLQMAGAVALLPVLQL